MYTAVVNFSWSFPGKDKRRSEVPQSGSQQWKKDTSNSLFVKSKVRGEDVLESAIEGATTKAPITGKSRSFAYSEKFCVGSGII